LSIFSDYAASIMDITGFQCMGWLKKCANCKLSLFSDKAASSCRYFLNKWGVYIFPGVFQENAPLGKLSIFSKIVCRYFFNYIGCLYFPWVILWHCYGYNRPGKVFTLLWCIIIFRFVEFVTLLWM
jgi:hypothetical protein